jgi:hypothetical protein
MNIPIPQTAEDIARSPLAAVLPLARSESEVKMIAAIRGYKAGWVKHIMGERVGRRLS